MNLCPNGAATYQPRAERSGVSHVASPWVINRQEGEALQGRNNSECARHVSIPCQEPDPPCLQHATSTTLDPRRWQRETFRISGGHFQRVGSPAIVIGGAQDHVHALFSLSKNHALKKIVEEVKKGSSKWMKAEGPKNPEFYWQSGYAGFSVSQSNVEEVRRYIENQEEHHCKMTFQDELRALFKRHGIEYDERFVWD